MMECFPERRRMTRGISHVLAFYDIHDPRRLIRVAKIMKDYGERVLKSVFECNLDEDGFLRMKERIDSVIDHTEDSVRFCFLCEKCLRNLAVSGLGCRFVEDEEVVIV
jgi:CRISPR-associated protein Cas2